MYAAFPNCPPSTYRYDERFRYSFRNSRISCSLSPSNLSTFRKTGNEDALTNNAAALLRVGFDTEDMISILQKLKKLRSIDQSGEMDDAAAVLMQYDINLASINKIKIFKSLEYITRRECVPIFEYLKDEIEMKNLATLVAASPELIYWKVSETKEKVALLTSFSGVKIDETFVRRYHSILNLKIECLQERISDIIDVLGEDLAKIIVSKYPRIIHTEKETLKASFNFFRSLLGDDRAKIVVIRNPRYLMIRQETRDQLLREMSRVFGEENCLSMVTRCSEITFIRWSNFEQKLNYALDTLELDLSVLVRSPLYFTYSLTQRIQPRYKKLVEAGYGVNLYSPATFLDLSNEKFEAWLAGQHYKEE